MKYCPYCAEALSKPVKVCPYCKKSLDFDLFREIIEPGEDSQLNRKLLLKKWFKESSHIIYPGIAFILGFILGAIMLYSFAQVQFAGQKSEYKEKIDTLEKTVSLQEAAAGDLQSDLKNQLKQKDRVIQSLLEQKDIYSRLIYFTNRLSSNSVITPNSSEDADYYKRNTLYLIRLFEETQSRLNDAKIDQDKSYTLQSVPQLLQ